MRTAALIISGMLALSLTACQVSPEPTPTTAVPSPSASPQSVEDELWSGVVALYPAAVRPDVHFIRFVPVNEMASTQVDCLHDEGFLDVVLTPDNGVRIDEIPSGQEEAYYVAAYSCNVRYQVDTKANAFTDQRIRALYAYYRDFLVPCLSAQGYDVPDIPSETTFVDGYMTTGWTPYSVVQPATQDAWYDINDECPQWPDGFWR